MANSSLQTEIKRIKEKRALYTKRVKDARKKNRPDIEKIWLNEIKVLDEKQAKLEAKQKGKTIKKPASGELTAKNSRKLRQLNNQIQYIERKIVIHRERGEEAAAQKQTALLLGLQAKQAKLTSPMEKTVKPTASTSSATPSTAQPIPVPATRSLSSSDQKKVNALNADIAHADKMIKEYQKFKSPKAETWIGKKFQLIAQRDKLTNNAAPQAQTTTQVTTPAQHTPPAVPQRTNRPNPQAIAAAQDTNNQVRVIDLEIAHADKMIREYQKYKSPKVNQWIHRKNELLARRSRITGPTNQHSTTASNAANQKRIHIIMLEVAHADKMIKEYQKYNSPKAHDWIEKRNDLLAEKARLEGSTTPHVSGSTSSGSATHSQPASRKTIKAQIAEFNRKAKTADTNMRAALKRGDHQQANLLHQQRDQYNQQAKQLTAQLSGASSGTSTSTPPAIPNRPTTTNNHSDQSSGRTGSSSALEKAIAKKYLQTRNYTNEHAYKEIIETLLEGKYQYLKSAKETLYDITNASQLPPRGTTINAPYIRDCFKIKISGVRLDGYTINDTIFNTTFPRDFDGMVDRINQHVAPAPKLKHYVHLAHRDAIQLIPSDRSISKYNSQFAGAMLKDVSIRNIRVESKGALQGLFASDGSFKNLHMENITVKTNSAHQIAILGLLSGTLDLSSPNGKPIHVNLLPLRLAGGHNIYINSFSQSSSYQYGSVNAGRSNAVINDNRRKMIKRGTYYKNFNMDTFFAAMRRDANNPNIFTRIKKAAKSAGTVIT